MIDDIHSKNAWCRALYGRGQSPDKGCTGEVLSLAHENTDHINARLT